MWSCIFVVSAESCFRSQSREWICNVFLPGWGFPLKKIYIYSINKSKWKNRVDIFCSWNERRFNSLSLPVIFKLFSLFWFETFHWIYFLSHIFLCFGDVSLLFDSGMYIKQLSLTSCSEDCWRVEILTSLPYLFISSHFFHLFLLFPCN